MIFVQVCLPLSIGVSRLCSHLFVPVVAFDDWNGSDESPDGGASAVSCALGSVFLHSIVHRYLPRLVTFPSLIACVHSFAPQVDNKTLLLFHVVEVLRQTHVLSAYRDLLISP